MPTASDPDPAEAARLIVGLIRKPAPPEEEPAWHLDDDWIDVPDDQLPWKKRRT
ncbi:hypothetical protein ACWEO1_06360 [Kitasatospora cineracea]